MKFNIAIVIGVLFITAGSSFAQSPPETAEFLRQGELVLPSLDDTKACANGSRSTIGVGVDDIIEVPPPPDGTLKDEFAAAGNIVCPPPEIDPDLRAPPGGPGTAR